MNVEVGDKIRITNMSGEPSYKGRVGTVEHIDDIGQLHGTWGGLAVIVGEDEFEIMDAFDGQDFVFLPSNPHRWWGSDAAAICYYNENGDDDKGGFEVGLIWRETALRVYRKCLDEFGETGFASRYIDRLWDEFSWRTSYFVGTDDPEFDLIVDSFKYADWPNGDSEAEFIIDWASGKEE